MVHACTIPIIHACTEAIHACTTAIIHACTIGVIHAWTISIVHACTINIIHAYSIAIIHACTITQVHARTIPIIHACTTVLWLQYMQILWLWCICIIAHVSSPSKGGSGGARRPQGSRGVWGGASPPMRGLQAHIIIPEISFKTIRQLF